MTEFRYDHTTIDGKAVYTTPHELWNTIEVTFPRDYFSNLPAIPRSVWLSINLQYFETTKEFITRQTVRDDAEHFADVEFRRAKLSVKDAAPLIALQIVEEMKGAEFSQGLPRDLEHASETADINVYGADFAARLLGVSEGNIEVLGDYLEAAQTIVDAFLRFKA